MVPPSGKTPFDHFNACRSGVADSDIASVTISSNAVTGSYRLEVTRLAQEHRLAST